MTADWAVRFEGKMAKAALRKRAGEAALRGQLGLGPWFGGQHATEDEVWRVGDQRLLVCVRAWATMPRVADPGRECDLYALVWVCPDGAARLVTWVTAATLRALEQPGPDGRWTLWSYAREADQPPTAEALQRRLGLVRQETMRLDAQARDMRD